MFEFIRLTRITLQTGEWFVFQAYVVFVWAVMLPRTLGAGVFYCFQPPEPAQLTPRYLLGRLLAISFFAVAIYYYAVGYVPDWGLLTACGLMILAVISPLRRSVVRFCFSWTFYAKHVKRVPLVGPLLPETPRQVVVLTTVFKPDHDILRRSLGGLRRSLELAGADFVMIGIVDGYGRFAHAKAAEPILHECCDIAMTSDAQDKRQNLKAMYDEAVRRGLIGPETIVFLHDDDTILSGDHVAAELLRPFADPRIGGVTTAQLVYEPHTWTQLVSFQFESARLFSSQPFMALFGQVACMPGRLYAVRAAYLEGRMEEMVRDHFSYFGLVKRRCVAGDDRFITNCILRGGGKCIVSLRAFVFTLAPTELGDLRRMWVRWGRSSQGYTIRSPWLLRYPAAAFVYWTDIGITLSTMYMVFVNWPYHIIFGEALLPFLQMLALAFLGMLTTMLIRQAPHYWKYPKYLALLPVFGPAAMFGHICRFESLVTQHRIGKWETRRGADIARVEEATFQVVHVRESLTR